MAKNLFGIEVGNKKIEVEKSKRVSPFDFAKAISTKTKEDIDRVESFIGTTTYSQYIINQIFTQTLVWKDSGVWRSSKMWTFMKEVNIMDISNRMHFDMLMNLVPQNPGFIKYHYKQAKDTDKDRIVLKWKFSEKDEVIEKYLKIIDEDELKEIYEEKKVWDKLHKTKKEKKK